MHPQDAVHLAGVDRDAAERRVDLALQRGAGAVGNDRNAVKGAEAHDVLHLGGGLGNTTASGGSGFSQVKVWACWSRTACEVTQREPNRSASPATTALTASGEGRALLSNM